MTMETGAYGLLLAFDAYGASARACGDEARLLEILRELPRRIGMRTLGTPHTVYVDEPGMRGYSAFTFIMESHISIHTYEERGFVTVDIYSCKDFDIRDATDYLVKAFRPSSFDTQVIVRGHNFHTSKPRRPKIRPHVRL